MLDFRFIQNAKMHLNQKWKIFFFIVWHSTYRIGTEILPGINNCDNAWGKALITPSGKHTEEDTDFQILVNSCLFINIFFNTEFNTLRKAKYEEEHLLLL